MKLGMLSSPKWKSAFAVSILIVGLSLLSSAPLFAQGSSGRVVGTITDANGGAVTGATVTILDVDRGTSRALTTDDSGAFNAPNLLPGNYKVRAEFKGFKTTERQNIVLEVGQELRIDLALQPGEQTQTITVTEEIPLVETTNAELGGTIQNEVINDLPLNGRNFENLLDLRPGVTKYVGNSGWTQSSNGLRPHDNFFMVEGVNSNDPWMAQSMMNAVMAAGDAGTMLPIDAIDEFKTQQNPRAEYGWKPGAIVNVGVKSGTNTIHGSAYAYGRSEAFDARNYFNGDAHSNPNCASDPFLCTKTPVELEQYGASVGGAIKKDKLFYFANYEGQRYGVGNPVQHTGIPIANTSPAVTGAGGPAVNLNTSSLIGACLAALPANGGSGATALSLQLAGLDATCTPLSNFPGLFPANNGTTTTFDTALTSVNRIYSGVAKIDYHLNDRNSFSGMYFISPGDGTFVDDPPHEVSQQWLTVQHARSMVGSVGWNYVPNSSWVNSFRFGYSHYFQTFVSADSTQNPASYSYNGSTYNLFTGQTDPNRFGLPEIQWNGNPYFLGASWPKTVGPDSVMQFSDSVSYLRGNHAFKFGGEVLVLQSTNNVTANTKGPIRFPDLTNFFEGNMNRARFTSGDLLRHLQDEGYAAFVQDDWRITPRLTVNLGVRYELTTVLKEKNNLMGNFDPVKGPEQVGVGGFSNVYNGDHNNFSPRVGFALDIAGNGKTVVRGGAGILYEQGSFDSLMAIGNLLGLRTEPTGVPIWTAASAGATLGGTIDVGEVDYTGGNLGPIITNWANNSASNPLYSPTPVCGDGNTTVPAGNGSLSGTTPAPCSVLGVDRNLRTPYVSTWSLGIQRALTNSLSLDVTYVGNHATKLVGLSDLNQPAIGSGWDPGTLAGCISAPGGGTCAPGPEPQPYASKFPYLNYIYWLSNSNVSNYNSLQVSMTQREMHGLSFVLGYTFAHALGESPDNWSFLSPINSNNPREIYGTTQFDVRHRFTFSTTYNIPGKDGMGQLIKGWSLNSIVTLESATPWGVNDFTTDFSGTNEINSNSPNGEQWDFFGNPADFQTTKALINTNGGAGGIPYAAGACTAAAAGLGNPYGNTDPSNPGCTVSVTAIGVANLSTNQTCNTKAAAIGAAAEASLATLGCYVSLNGKSVLIPPAFGTLGTTAPNMFRGTPYYNVDLNVTKVFKVKERLSFQFRAEFFNIFNHPEISNPFGGPGGDNTYTDPSGDAGASFGFRPTTPDVLSSNPVLGSGGARAMQLGLKILF
ncbi:MAG TPA: TonB-dependent receptor [Verrucomicrobiae bacterium]|nr:TonB-dependent receptor [Verrucomicrobiae bacterium]